MFILKKSVIGLIFLASSNAFSAPFPDIPQNSIDIMTTCAGGSQQKTNGDHQTITTFVGEALQSGQSANEAVKAYQGYTRCVTSFNQGVFLTNQTPSQETAEIVRIICGAGKNETDRGFTTPVENTKNLSEGQNVKVTQAYQGCTMGLLLK